MIPDSIRFDPSKSLENKPKGLVDSLSKFFTPGMKRTSRTALSTLIKPPSELETATPINKKRKALFTSSGDDEGDEDGIESASENISLSQLKKKNRRIKSLDHPSDPDPDSSPAAAVGQRRRHTSSGQSQVRSLYDGLSHLYTDCDSRLRHIPSTNYADKKRKDESTGKTSKGFEQ